MQPNPTPRPCLVGKLGPRIPDSFRHKLTDTTEVLFHCFAQEVNGDGIFPVGIVEYPDGRLDTIAVCCIQFLPIPILGQAQSKIK